MAAFGPRQLRALERLGDIMVPGGEGFPSFSEACCAAHLNELAEEANPDDIKLLAVFLTILSIKPDFALRMFCWLLMRADRFPEFLAVPLRQLNIALRGLTISPYFANLTGPGFAGRDPHTVMGYELTRIED